MSNNIIPENSTAVFIKLIGYIEIVAGLLVGFIIFGDTDVLYPGLC